MQYQEVLVDPMLVRPLEVVEEEVDHESDEGVHVDIVELLNQVERLPRGVVVEREKVVLDAMITVNKYTVSGSMGNIRLM